MPESLINKIDQAAKYQGRLISRATLMSLLTIVLAASGIFALVDYLGRFSDPGLRWLASASVGVLFVYFLTRYWNKIWHATPTRLSMSQKIEACHSGLGSRLSSAVAFYDQSTNDPAAGSQELRRAVVIQADQDAEEIQFKRAIDTSLHRKALRRFGILLTTLLVLFILSPAGFSLGLKRLLLPWSESPWPRANHLTLVDPPTTITQGDSINLVCHDLSGTLPDDLRVEYRLLSEGKKRIETDRMAIVGEEGVASRQNIQTSLEFRVLGGDDDTMPWNTLEVLAPPKLEYLTIKIYPPSYTGMAPYESQGRVEALAGSKISISAKSNQELSSAQIEFSTGDSIECQLVENDYGLEVLSDSWKVVTDNKPSNATWQMVLNSKNGSTLETEKRIYRVLNDNAPDLKWVSPEGDTFLTTRAVLPIEIKASDDLAISECWIDAKVTLIDNEAVNESPSNKKLRHQILDLLQNPPSKESLGKSETSQFTSTWDLQNEKLSAGTRLDLVAKANDFLPQEGSTSLPRRIFLVTDEEFQARLAKKQSRLLSALQETINSQRTAFELTEALAMEVDLNQSTDRKMLDKLASAEFEQRQAASQLSNQLGVISQTERLLDEIKRNRLEDPELESQMLKALKQLKGISSDKMPSSKNDLAEARRNLQRDNLSSSKRSLESAIDNQLDSIEELEKIAKSLTGWSDFQRLSQELASIEERQRNLAERSAKLAMKSASGNPLERVEQQIERKKLSSEQAENNRRFNQIQQTLSDLLSTTENSKRSDSQNAASDALQEAEERNIAGGMRNASSRLARNQLGRAAQQQQQSADDLREMLETLRSRANNDPEKLVAELEKANKRLNELEQKARQESEASKPDSNKSKQLSKDSYRMSRKLERLSAQAASQKASQAADSASRSAQNQSPSSQSDLEQTAESLKQAQQEVEKRIAELEQEQAERLLDRLEKELPRFQNVQQTILEETKIASEEANNQRQQLSSDLQNRQQQLQEEVASFSDGLAPKPVFQHALAGATDQMQIASSLLTEERLGRPTQRSEYLALQRLKQIEQVLKTHREQNEQQQQQQNGGQGSQNGEPPEPLPFEVAELKMLRLMQLELIDQTRMFQADRAQAMQSGRFDDKTWNSEANDLSQEQNELSELALEMANRNNEP